MNAKQWYTSKTLWINILGLAIIVAQAVAQTYPVDPNLLALVIVILNGVMRFISGEPIAVGNRVFGRKELQ